MKITGSVEIWVRDAKTLEVQKVIKQDNLIPNATFQEILGPRYSWQTDIFRKYICITNQSTAPSRENVGIGSIIGQGYVPTGVASPIFVTNLNPPYMQIQQRIDSVGVARDFQTIGLASPYEYARAYLLLDSPCTQGANEILDIFYRISFANTRGEGFVGDIARDFGYLCTYGGLPDLSSLSSSLCHAPPSGFGYTDPSASALNRRGPSVAQAHVEHFKINNQFLLGLGDDLGVIYNSLYTGHSVLRGSAAYAWDEVAKNQASPVQNFYGHIASCPFPFFESLNVATGNGKPLLNGSSWSEKWPEFVRIYITDSGGVGAAKYKFSIRKLVGFAGNSFVEDYSICPFINPISQPYPNAHGHGPTGKLDWLKWSTTKIVTYSSAGVNLLDVYSGEYQAWNGTATTPKFSGGAALNIGQCAVSPATKKIYAACRATGLYEIDTQANTITQISSTPCYGVDVGRNGVVYAVFSGRIACSQNWATALTFSFTGISDGKWDNVQYIKVDPTHPNDHMLLLASISDVTQIVWWEHSSGSATQGPGNLHTLIRNPGTIDVSDGNSFWATTAYTPDRLIPLAKLTFGTGGYADLGVGAMSQVRFWGNNAFSAQHLVDINGTIVNSANMRIWDISYYPYGYWAIGYNDWYGRSGAPFVHLGDGLCLVGNFMRVFPTDNTYVWRNYGWDANASQWVLNGNGSKSTHADEQNLVQGLKVKFENGASAPHFVATERYEGGICWGILKDNATYITHEVSYYVKPAQFDVPLPTSGAALKVPNQSPHRVYFPVAPLGSQPDPDFIRIETASKFTIQLTLNGMPITNVWLGNEVPVIGEIRVDGATGAITFAAADAGKTIGGSYAYIKH